MEMAHVRISKKFFGKPALNFRTKFFYDQVIGGVHS
jgi:hypothetical protein